MLDYEATNDPSLEPSAPPPDNTIIVSLDATGNLVLSGDIDPTTHTTHVKSGDTIYWQINLPNLNSFGISKNSGSIDVFDQPPSRQGQTNLWMGTIKSNISGSVESYSIVRGSLRFDPKIQVDS